MNASNLFDDCPAELAEELFTELHRGKGFRIERIVSRGHCSPADFWYDQGWHEWVLLIRGSAGVLFEGDAEPVVLRPGSYLDIPAHTRHRVAWTDLREQTVWLAIHHDEPTDDATLSES
jgi:cupin 2 domain-containing protein